MYKVAFFDTKPYDRASFDPVAAQYGFTVKYYETKLNADTAPLAAGCDAAVSFVNDKVDEAAIDRLCEGGVRLLALRCAGFNHVDIKHAYGKLHVVRVPAYSPYAVAEHAAALLLTLVRKTHRAYIRTRDYNFTLSGMTGFDLHGKTAGIVGTGKIGRVFLDICRGFGMNVLAYDPFPVPDADFQYVSLPELLANSDIISLHCPLTSDTHHLLNADTLATVKQGAVIINTSRGALIDAEALLNALRDGRIGGAGLDVYEEESDLFFEDLSDVTFRNDLLTRLIALPNVIVTSHQGFLTREALENIAATTAENIRAYFEEGALPNEICYHCSEKDACRRNRKSFCFRLGKADESDPA